MPATLADLVAVLPQLPERDRSFAESLIAGWRRYGRLTDKQAKWPDILIGRVGGAEAPRTTVTVGSMAGVLELFGLAVARLKRPQIVLLAGGLDIVLSIATARAQVPGSINVVDGTDPSQGRWLGRILVDGTFEASRKFETPAAVIAKLVELAADPARVATEHGRLTGKCCFCNIALTDGRSTGVGYGRTCAKNWGLAWGAATRHEFTCESTSAAIPTMAF